MNKSECLKLLNDFRSRGEETYIFCCHAAVPLIITPDLLYQLWNNFKQYEYKDEPQVTYRVSHIAISDILLSRLCREVGIELYEFDKDIRDLLLEDLVSNIGDTRKKTVARFLEDYAQVEFRYSRRKSLKDIHLLTAQSILDPAQMEKQIINKINGTNSDREKLNYLVLHHNLIPEDYDSDLVRITRELVNPDKDDKVRPILIREENEKAEGVLKVILPSFLEGRIQRLPQTETVDTDKEKLAIINERIEEAKKSSVLALPGLGLTYIPESVFELEDITHLDLSNNQIQELPDKWTLLPNLEVLYLSRNFLLEIPLSIFGLKKLEVLDVSETQISFLPSEISQLTNLRQLELSDTSIRILPYSITELKNLEFLFFDDDNIDNIPEKDRSLRISSYHDNVDGKEVVNVLREEARPNPSLVNTAPVLLISLGKNTDLPAYLRIITASNLYRQAFVQMAGINTIDDFYKRLYNNRHTLKVIYIFNGPEHPLSPVTIANCIRGINFATPINIIFHSSKNADSVWERLIDRRNVNSILCMKDPIRSTDIEAFMGFFTRFSSGQTLMESQAGFLKAGLECTLLRNVNFQDTKLELPSNLESKVETVQTTQPGFTDSPEKGVIEDFEYDVFISYYGGDFDKNEWILSFVEDLKRDLELQFGRPVKIWYSIGQFSLALVEGVISRSATFLCFVTKDYNNSKECWRELEHFINNAKANGKDALDINRIFPVLLEDVHRNAPMPLPNISGYRLFRSKRKNDIEALPEAGTSAFRSLVKEFAIGLAESLKLVKIELERRNLVSVTRNWKQTVLISYDEKGKEAAGYITNKLFAAGIYAWMELRIDSVLLSNETEQYLSYFKTIIFLISEVPVENIMRFAVETKYQEKNIIPVFADEQVPLPGYFRNYPTISLAEDRGAIDDLIKQIQNITPVSPKGRYKVYISSTYSDLKYREELINMFQKFGDRFEVLSMEHYVLASEHPLERSVADVRNADIFILLLAGEYGYIPDLSINPEQRSIIELEYDAAMAANKKILAFIKRDSVAKDERIQAFRNKVATQQLVGSFESARGVLVSEVIASLASMGLLNQSSRPELDEQLTKAHKGYIIYDPADINFKIQLREQLRLKFPDTVIEDISSHKELAVDYNDYDWIIFIYSRRSRASTSCIRELKEIRYVEAHQLYPFVFFAMVEELWDETLLLGAPKAYFYNDFEEGFNNLSSLLEKTASPSAGNIRSVDFFVLVNAFPIWQRNLDGWVINKLLDDRYKVYYGPNQDLIEDWKALWDTQIQKCKMLLFVLAGNTDWAREGIEEVSRLAVKHRKRIICLSGNKEKSVPDVFKPFPCIYFTPGFTEGYQRLISIVENINLDLRGKYKRPVERPKDTDPNGFYLTHKLEAEIRKRGRLDHGEFIVDYLLIFSTSSQHTWLIFSNKNVLCVLDDIRKRDNEKLIQWKQKLQDCRQLSTVHNTSETGRLNIGVRTGWLYSYELFSNESIIEPIKAHINEASKFS